MNATPRPPLFDVQGAIVTLRRFVANGGALVTGEVAVARRLADGLGRHCTTSAELAVAGHALIATASHVGALLTNVAADSLDDVHRSTLAVNVTSLTGLALVDDALAADEARDLAERSA